MGPDIQSICSTLGQLTADLDCYRDTADIYATLDLIEKIAKVHKADMRAVISSTEQAMFYGQRHAVNVVRRQTPTTRYSEVVKDLKMHVAPNTFADAMASHTRYGERVTLLVSKLSG
jgi:hypothetical protein|tara:strand:- start:262 stop:612 length:351 start_codon:yes stop_codon:yes gene_type:complete